LDKTFILRRALWQRREIDPSTGPGQISTKIFAKESLEKSQIWKRFVSNRRVPSAILVCYPAGPTFRRVSRRFYCPPSPSDAFPDSVSNRRFAK
jgi:hypothetical protein